MSGFRGAMLQAVKLDGAKGDLEASDNLLWMHMRGTSYVPSALLYDDKIYFLRTNTGRLSCVNIKNGEAHYEGQGLSGVRQVYSSPVGANGYVYVTSRDGKTKVIKHGDKFEEVGTNELDDTIDSTARDRRQRDLRPRTQKALLHRRSRRALSVSSRCCRTPRRPLSIF